MWNETLIEIRLNRQTRRKTSAGNEGLSRLFNCRENKIHFSSNFCQKKNYHFIIQFTIDFLFKILLSNFTQVNDSTKDDFA